MSEDTVTIEVDGRPLQARKGQMLIDVTDAAGIYIPRFCYHKKLSVAANCRMCLVEVERAPKPQPACATPVMDGMKVFTQSEKAVSGQKATMEFLLINHPLDCPICDQGGECELQDLAMGYGGDVSQYVERKRVVRDKDIGPLVQTDMTRCIHCTRCVRFGEEVAGLRELGATGRGEHMEIGTYVQHAMTSELSGNVIDLCPVGALTSKPYRFSARAWELQSRPTIAPHDCVGSNLSVHLKGQVVKRVVPLENEAVNETWISDRDRFSYQGLRHEDRLLAPRLKQDGVWKECDWDTALRAARDGLATHGEGIGVLASPSSTCEEYLLLRRLGLGLGAAGIDYRLRHLDFSPAVGAPRQGSGFALGDLSRADVVLVIGGYPRHDQPLVHHRIRQAALRGAQVFVIDVLRLDYNFDLTDRLTVAPDAYALALAGIVAAAGTAVEGASSGEFHRAAAQALAGGARSFIVLASEIERSPVRSSLETLARLLAQTTSSVVASLTGGSNAVGLSQLGCTGSGVVAQFEQRLPAYVLLGFDPARDVARPALAMEALEAAQTVVALTAFRSPELDAVANVQLPIALHAENEGSFVNVQGDRQVFAAAVKPPAEARPAWKILRVLGDMLALDGFDAVTLSDLTAELEPSAPYAEAPLTQVPPLAAPIAGPAGALLLHASVPMYSLDPLVRRAASLQQQPQVADEIIRVAPASLHSLRLADGDAVRVAAGGRQARGTVAADERVPEGVAWVQATSELAFQCGGSTRCVLDSAPEGGAG